jgi:hypothetical protein
MQTKNADLTEGDEAFVKVEVTEQGRNSNLESLEFEDRECIIDRVVDADAQGRFYRIRWLGYEEKENTWEPKENIPSQLIRRYWRKLGGRNP